jgi:hypothetical protein
MQNMHLVAFERVRQREEVARVVVDDKQLLAGDRGRRSMNLLQEEAFVFRQLGL